MALFSPDQTKLVTACSDPSLDSCSAYIWHAFSGKQACAPLEHSDGVLSVSFSHDGKRILTACEDFTVAMWDLQGAPQGFRKSHRDAIYGARFHSNDRWILSTSRDQTARIWDGATGEAISPALFLSFAPDTASFTGIDLDFAAAGNGLSSFHRLRPETRSLANLKEIGALVSGDSALLPAQGDDRRKKLAQLWAKHSGAMARK